MIDVIQFPNQSNRISTRTHSLPISEFELGANVANLAVAFQL